jgi:hypothetical protein
MKSQNRCCHEAPPIAANIQNKRSRPKGSLAGRSQSAFGPAPLPKCPARQEFEAFLAVPMASLSEEAYISQRRDAQRIAECLKKYCGLDNIYNPAALISSKKEFDPSAVSIAHALDAIRSSRALIMLYTVEKPSSILVEAGCALARDIPSLYFVRKPLTLPFLLNAAATTLPHVHLHEYSDIEDVFEFIEKSGRDLFSPTHSNGL